MFDQLGTKHSIPPATTRKLRAGDCIVIDNRDLRKARTRIRSTARSWVPYRS